MHTYSKTRYKPEQEPDDQLSGGSTALWYSPGASGEKRKKLSKRETFNAVTKRVKMEKGTRINQG